MSSRIATGDRTGIPPARRWTLTEVALSGALLAVAALAWVLAHRLSMPDMRTGILFGARPMTGVMRPLGLDAVLFVATWTVMMAAMMLPGVVPFTVGLSRLLRAGGANRAAPVLVILGYLVVWCTAGVAAYAVLRGLELLPGDRLTVARVGAIVLVCAGVYELTPLKRVCLRHCRSPVALLMKHGQAALRGRFGAVRAGVAHGGYCLGCCWALMAVLSAMGVMSLTWMAGVAAVVAVEKLHGRGVLIGRVLGGALIAVGAVLLIEPALVATMG